MRTILYAVASLIFFCFSFLVLRLSLDTATIKKEGLLRSLGNSFNDPISILFIAMILASITLALVYAFAACKRLMNPKDSKAEDRR